MFALFLECDCSGGGRSGVGGSGFALWWAREMVLSGVLGGTKVGAGG